MTDPMSLDELIDVISQLSREERDVVFFALFADIHLKDAVTLQRHDLKTRPWLRAESGAVADRIVRNAPFYIRSPYVFWELRAGHAEPLTDIHKRLFDVTGMSFEEFRERSQDSLKLVADSVVNG
ncbi:hypothetical protein ACWJJH_20350 [Endozoicomonadaceae bacterium StTr2]